MAFNITGGISINRSVPRNAPNAPTDTAITRTTKTMGRLTWKHTPSIVTPHSSFRVEYKTSTDTTYETLGTIPSTAVGVADADGAFTFNFDVNNIANLTATYNFRVFAVSTLVGSLSTDSAASPVATLVPNAINTPTNGMVNVTGTNDTREISFQFLDNAQMISHFEIEYQPGLASAVTEAGWQILTTLGDKGTMGTTTTYDFIQNGFAVVVGQIQYRVRAVTVNNEFGSYSELFAFVPVSASDISNFIYTRLSLDFGQLSWSYSGTPVKSFVVEEKVTGAPDSTWTNAATIDADAPENKWQFGGQASETVSIDYRMRTIGINGEVGSNTNAITVVPLAPAPPTNFIGLVNEGVGLTTSATFTWTSPVEVNTHSAEFQLQFRHVGDDEWVEIAVFTPDVNRAEIIPPQQGLLQFRLGTVGSNGLPSTFTAVVELNFVAGFATDDAIYNGDGAFIANQHFAVPSDDICMIYNPTGLDGISLPPINGVDQIKTGPAAKVVSGGMLFPATATQNAYIQGTAGQPLILDWRFEVEQDLVDTARHFYLNLDALETVGNPTRDWDVLNNNVLIQVSSDPFSSANMYFTGTTSHVYTDSGTPSDEDNTRTYDDRFQDSHMYATRDRIRLTMRRTFTFRASGFIDLRITFLPDDQGAPLLRLPPFAPEFEITTTAATTITPDGVNNILTFTVPHLQPVASIRQVLKNGIPVNFFLSPGQVAGTLSVIVETTAAAVDEWTIDYQIARDPTSICFEAWASEVTETIRVPDVGLAGVRVNYEKTYETIPMVVATPGAMCLVWYSDPDRTGVTIHSGNPLDLTDTTSRCNVDLTIRGY